MRKCFSIVLGAVSLAICLLTPILATAQDALSPKWTALTLEHVTGNAVAPNLITSDSGSRILSDRLGSGFSVYDSTGKMLCHEEMTGYTGARISIDGLFVFYGAPTATGFAVYKYTVATGARVVLPGTAEASAITVRSVSPDGLKIGYAVSSGTIGIYDISTSTMLCHSAGLDNSSINFVNSSTCFVDGTFSVYNFAGSFQYQLGHNLYSPVYSRDGSALYGMPTTGSTLTRYDTSNFSVVWSVSVPSDDISGGMYAVSRDGETIFHYHANGDARYIYAMSASTGLDLSSVQIPSRFGAFPSLRKIFSGPGAKSFLANIVAQPSISETHLGGYDSTSNSVSLSGILLESQVPEPNTTPIASKFFAPGTGGSMFIEGFRGNLVRETTNGTIVACIDHNPGGYRMRAFSPNGAYYVTGTSDTDLGVYRTSDDHLMTTLFNPSGVSTLGWDSDTMIWSRNQQLKVDTFKFDGTALSHQVRFTGAMDQFGISPDGSISAGLISGSVKVSDAVGTLIKKIVPLSGTSVIDRIQFAQGNRLMIHEFDSSTLESTVRVYDFSGVPFLVRTFSETLPASRSVQGAISPSGFFVALASAGPTGADGHVEGAVKVYRVSDGLIVRDWENRMLGVSLTTLDFSWDDFVLTWRTGGGVVIAAVIPPMITSMSLSATSVPGGTPTMATVTMNRVVNQDTVVHPSVSTGLVTVPSSVTVPSGTSSATFAVTTHGVASTTAVPIGCTFGGFTVSNTLTLTPATALTVTLDKTNIEGVGTATGTITLNAPAGPGGLSVKVTSSKTSSATVSPATVVIPADSTTGTFFVTTKNSTADFLVTFTAKTSRFSGTVNLMVVKLASVTLSLDKTTIAGGDTATLTVTRSVAAPTGGLTYQLGSDNAALIPPTQIVLPEGETTASVTVNTASVTSNTTGTITLANGSQVKTIDAIVIPLGVTSLSSNPTDVTGSGSIDVTIYLNGAAPAGFTLAGSSNANAITVPASISIPAGQTSYVLTLAVKKVTADRTVTITIGGKTVSVTLHKP